MQQQPRPVLIGESYAGEGAEVTHTNTVLAAVPRPSLPAKPFFSLV